MKPLQGKVAVVAGATRGAGRGIARMLGEAGALVYCTGRSVRGSAATPGRPETIDETAELVAQHGGVGIAVQVDHRDENAVEALFARVRADQGRLDILVNDIWGGDELIEWGTPFWKLETRKGLAMLETAITTHIITSRHAVPLMIERDAGLIVEITDGDHLGWRGNLFYDLAKTTTIRLAYSMAANLRGTQITALAVTPGYLRSEAMLERYGVTEENWRDACAKSPHFIESETPFYVGRAVAELAADPNVHAKAGKTWASWTLMREYGFKDADGRQPDWGRYYERVVRELLERGGPYGWYDRFLLLARLHELDFEPGGADEREHIATALASAEQSR